MEYTVEGVLKGHPDKICDQISDALLDSYMELDKNARTAIECLGTNENIIIAGEVYSKYSIPVEEICKKIYYNITHLSPKNVVNLLHEQSQQLSCPINSGCAGDQGIMYGYACNTIYNYLPYGYWLVNLLTKRLDEYREKSEIFLPDGKIQLTIKNEQLDRLSISVQHELGDDLSVINDNIKKNILYDVETDNISINENSGFVKGGFDNDTGLTGRKIIIDTYGGLAPHGGGAFSGKDCTKVDRSAAYMCRFVAKNIVANGFANDCTVSVAYEFGKENPVMLSAKTHNVYSSKITNFIKNKFDFRPNSIIETLNLREIKYLPTATYGHFTNSNYPWEKIIKL